MRRFAALVACLSLSGACGSPDPASVGDVEASVVYGADDRMEVYAHPNESLQAIARESIVAVIPWFYLDGRSDGTYDVVAPLLRDDPRFFGSFCEDEPFGNQPTAAVCSATLIADDLVLTAGHCFDEGGSCDRHAFVFDYHLEGPDELLPVRAENVYSCEELVLDLDSSAGSLAPDFSVVRLDRPVGGNRRPVDFRVDVPLDLGDPVAMIGFGTGLPTKIDDGAAVADPRIAERDFYLVNLDAFQGHSGSGIFDSQSRLAGILIGGRVPDYDIDEEDECYRPSFFEDSEAREFAHDIAPIIGTLCAEGLTDGEWCEPDACGGESCGEPVEQGPRSSGGGGGGVVPAATGGGCSASGPVGGLPPVWLAIGLLLVSARLRRKAA